MSADTRRIARIRSDLPAVAHVRYFNNGTCGPLPVSSARAMADEAAREVETGRVGEKVHARAQDQRARLRAALTQFLGAPDGTVALTHHTTEGMNIAVLGHDFTPGDEILTTDVEHPGALAPLYTLRERRGVRLTALRVGADAGDLPERVRAAIGPRTRLLVLSHVSYSTGALLPVAEVAAVCRQRRVPVVVDGAQSAGAIAVDVVALGVDAYAIPGQKWLYGPEGTGALYVRREVIPTLVPPMAGYHSVAEHDDEALTYTFHPDARRFEVGSMYLPGLRGLQASLSWLHEDVGVAWAHRRIRTMALQCRERIAALSGARLITPEPAAGLVVFTLDGVDPEAAVATLEAKGIAIRWIPRPRALRVSVGLHNDESDLEALVEALAQLARG